MFCQLISIKTYSKFFELSLIDSKTRFRELGPKVSRKTTESVNWNQNKKEIKKIQKKW